MLYLVLMYRSWSPRSISTKLSIWFNFRVTSVWRHIRQNGKKSWWWNLFLTIKILGTSDFLSWVCDKSFFEWIVKHEKISLGSKAKNWAHLGAASLCRFRHSGKVNDLLARRCLPISERQVVLTQLYKYHHESGKAASSKLVWKQH